MGSPGGAFWFRNVEYERVDGGLGIWGESGYCHELKSLVWHDFGEGKTSSVLSGSPLDLLPFHPSCLPMPPRADNQKVGGVGRVCYLGRRCFPIICHKLKN